MESTENTEKNKIQMDLIKSGLVNFKNEIKNMSGNEKRIEKPNEIVDIVEKILDFNKTYQEGK